MFSKGISGIADITNICQYCHQQSDTLVHYIVYCTDVAIFWKQFGKMWKRIFDYRFPLDILFGVRNETCDEIIDTLNYCLLFAKFYIYRTKKSESKVFFKLSKGGGGGGCICTHLKKTKLRL